MQFSVSQVRDLALLLEQSGLHEISFAMPDATAPDKNESSLKIVVRAAPKRRRRVAPPTVAENISGELSTLSEVQETTMAEASELLETAFAPLAVPILATAVGLFSLAPNVEIGTTVKKNQVVAFVESMKIPTEVRAPQNGVVQEVFVEANQGVEYGQTLLSLVAEG